MEGGETRMKKVLIFAVIMLFVASAAFATIVGSKHDMREHQTGMTLGYNEVCVYCHTPHGAATGVTLPLWNRNMPTNGSYQYYNNPNNTLNATLSGTLTGQSLACMSCHDGTVAIDALVNTPNYGLIGTFTNNVSAATKMLNAGNGYLGTDLRNDHPVSFTFDTALHTADAGLNDPVDATGSGLGGTVRLFNSRVECASCHNVHDNTTAQPFLRGSNAGSALCLACHNK